MKRIGVTIYESTDATQATRLEFAVVSTQTGEAVPSHGSDAALKHDGRGVIERSRVFELQEGTELRLTEVKAP